MQRSIFLAAIVVTGCGDNLHAVDSSVDATQIDAFSCVPAAQHPQLATINRGDLVVDATQSVNIAALTVPLDHSVLFTTIREDEPSPQYGSLICDLEDANAVNMTPAGIVCQRPAAGTDKATSTGIVHVAWTVVTFTSGVLVQRGQVNTGITNPAIVALAPAVDPASSFVLIGGMISGGGGWGNNEFVRANLIDGQNLDVRTNVAGTRTAWQVVSIAGASVQRGTTAFGATDTTGQVPIMPILSGGGLILTSYNTDNPSSVAAAQLMLQATLTDSAITFKRGAGGAALDIVWEAVALPVFARAVTTTFAAGEATKTESVANLPAASSVAIASNQAVLGQSSGSTDYAGADLDLLGVAAATMTVADGSVALERAASDSSASVTWTAIDFAHDRCDPN